MRVTVNFAALSIHVTKLTKNPEKQNVWIFFSTAICSSVLTFFSSVSWYSVQWVVSHHLYPGTDFRQKPVILAQRKGGRGGELKLDIWKASIYVTDKKDGDCF